MVRWVCWYPLSSTDPNNINQTGKITCYVILCVHLCSCKFDVLILLVSVGFKTSRRCYSKGEVCNWCKLYAHENVVFNYMVDLVP